MIDFSIRLEQAAEQMGLRLDDKQRQDILLYLELIQKWNKTYNITAIKDAEQILIQHLFDSLAVIPSLVERYDPQLPLTVLDVGSGGGLPGVVIAICCPQWQVTCVDAVEKKTAFITMVAGRLGLKNLRSKHGRIEDYRSHEADLVISRAFASLRDFANWSGHTLKVGGLLAAMKGHYLADEVADLECNTDWQLSSWQKLQVVDLDAERCLLWISKKD
ncbi:16S rRNA (guanine(527)-N(7))-methyltransferase RsmG [Oligella urethralis]|uniref:16S rRNA (guanine(527)-N(7))-methyltransferase RsmG n=1 Tax=Oligella urethralis TaxID=90245 RepID=UPI00037F35FA|nr:16S rRNA (guanine(527)-N(7))-methyltransferase RsmG [Oligella urethralis]SUA69159.1 Ribosomal RNA small subunit methyltransferase G [Oligella urethralis]